MNAPHGIGTVPSPTHPAKDFVRHESECRSALKPLMISLLDMAESAGWNRRTAASTLMFLAAQQLTTTAGNSRDVAHDAKPSP
ncbi:hypothetical protein [Mesorhizobium sp. IMUNJ 23232]|uniref:hypothetical protein n=1 Tax=Mesorhizobium sp. IMUNJ 23232 TaxID=3376064 RepID=UPI00378D6CCE